MAIFWVYCVEENTAALVEIVSINKHRLERDDSMYPAIIFIHHGNSECLFYAIWQAKYSNHNSRIILLGDRANIHYKWLLAIEHYPIESYANEVSHSLKNYFHLSTNGETFERLCLKRWFVLYKFLCLHPEISQCVYLDSDVLIYDSLDVPAQNLEHFGMTIVGHSAHTNFVSNKNLLGEFCSFIQQHYNESCKRNWLQIHYNKFIEENGCGGISDMTFFQKFYSENPDKVGITSMIFNYFKKRLIEMGELFLFLHIPKTAGTTVHYLLERQFKNETDKLFTIYKEGHTEKAYQKLESLNTEQLNRIKVIRGHMPFGWHHLCPGKKFSYFTLFRHPIERVISHYYYELDNPERPFHYLAAKMGLEQYVEESGVIEIDNGQTRFIAGALEIPFKKLSNNTLERAKDNLVKHFSVFGFLEKFDEFLVLLAYKMCWKRPFFYTPKNVNKSRRYIDNIPRHILIKLEGYCKLDLELYEFARTLYMNRISEFPELHDRVKKFHDFNNMFRLIYPVYKQVKFLMNNF